MDQEQERQPPPEHLKPWYYQYWFLYPVVVFWPLWSILIIRSPWHNGLASGAIAWAMLISGGYLIGYRQIYLNRDLNDFTITILVPGVVLTFVTQAFWIRDRSRVREAMRHPPASVAVVEGAEPDKRAATRRRSTRSRRRGTSRSRRRT